MNEQAPSPPRSNSLGNFGLAIAIAAFVFSTTCRITASRIEDRRSPVYQHEPGDMRLEVVAEKAEHGLSFIGQLIVYGIGGLVGGTLSVAAIIAGTFALKHEPKGTAIACLAFGSVNLAMYLL